MKRIWAAAFSFVALVAAEPVTAAAVEQIEARLFLAHTGTFSEPVPKGATLWNTIIGEAGLREPSSATLVKILVSGDPKSYDAKAKVQLTVRAKTSKTRRVLAKRLSVFGSEGKQYVAFWLPETGCDELVLQARVSGSEKTIKHTVPFRCGE